MIMLLKCCTQYVSKFGKLSSGHRTGKGQFSFQSQRKAMPKNVQTTIQLLSFHMLVKLWSNPSSQASAVCELRTPRCTAGFRKGRGTRDQIASIYWAIEKAREFQKNIYFSFIDSIKDFDSVDQKKLWKILKKMGMPDTLSVS